MKLVIYVTLLCLTIIGFVIYKVQQLPEYSPSDPSEAHDLWYGDEWVSPEDHERRQSENQGS